MFLKSYNYKPVKFLQFSPYYIYIFSYAILYYSSTLNKTTNNVVFFNKLPLIAILLTTFYSFFTFNYTYSFQKRLNIFLSGIAQPKIIENILIIFLSCTFSYMTLHINSVLTATNIFLLITSTQYIFIYLFLITGFSSFLIQHMPLTINICLPIAYGIAQSLQLSIPYTAATVLSGTLFGYHMLYYYKIFFSIKSKYYILQIPRYTIIPTTIITLWLLKEYLCVPIHPQIYTYLLKSLSLNSFITLIPYLWIVISQFFKLHILLNLFVANTITLSIGLWFHHMNFLSTLIIMGTSFCENPSYVSIILINIITPGIYNILKYNRGIDYIAQKLYAYHHNVITVQISIVLLQCINNLMNLIDTTSNHEINVIIKKLSEKHQISFYKISIITELLIPTIQCLLPYSLINYSTCSYNLISYEQIIFYMIYPITFLTLLFFYIVLFSLKYEKQ